MYSWEIENELKKRNFVLTSKEYMDLLDLDKSPQIRYLTYDTYENVVIIETTDKYKWYIRLENS